MIRNLADLAKHVGAAEPTEESIGRRLYKDTRCGVSFGFATVEYPTRWVPRTFTVRWVQSITGWKAVTFRQGHGKKGHRAEMPPALCLYLDLDQRGNVAYDPTTIEATQIVKRTPAPFGGLWMTLRIDVPVYRASRPGVYVCGYAEGSDGQPLPHLLAFPFTGAAFDTVLAAADKDGCDLFDALHASDVENPDL